MVTVIEDAKEDGLDANMRSNVRLKVPSCGKQSRHNTWRLSHALFFFSTKTLRNLLFSQWCYLLRQLMLFNVLERCNQLQ